MHSNEAAGELAPSVLALSDPTTSAPTTSDPACAPVITHAVLVADGSPRSSSPPVIHLYRSRREADECANAYCRALGVRALVADLAPPLPERRAADLWAVYDDRLQTLRCTPARPADAGAQLIRREQPANQGVPQFAPGC